MCNVGIAKIIPRYNEIFARVPLEELKRRDTKGIYLAGGDWRPANIVGLDIPAEIPEAPDLILDNDTLPGPRRQGG
jgi:adenylylsulfate kinase-like enzyme